MADILPHAEAEAYVRELRAFELQEVGSRAWQEQHRRLERLNLQAHQNLSYAREEFVSELLSSYQKWDVVLDELTCTFLFKQRVWPHVFAALARAGDAEARELEGRQTPVSVFLYTILFHEAVLCNLVTATIIDRLPPAEHLDDLIDWAATRVRSLITRELSYVPRALLEAAGGVSAAAGGAGEGGAGGAAGAGGPDPLAAAASAPEPLRSVLEAVFGRPGFDPRYPAAGMAAEVAGAAAGRRTAGASGSTPGSTQGSAPGPAPSPSAAVAALCHSLYQQDCDITYKVALECTTVFRGLTGHDLPLSARHKLQANRVIVTAARLLSGETTRAWGDLYPWQRVLTGPLGPAGRAAAPAGAAGSAGAAGAPGAPQPRYQHLDNHGEWVDYTSATERAYRLSLYEAQAWIAMLQLAVQNTAEFTPGEVDVLESVKGRINEALVDQLPPLKELRRFLEQVCLARPAAEAAAAPGTLPYYQQKVRHNYSLGDPLADPRDLQRAAPGAILVQLESGVERDLVRRLRFWAEALQRRRGPAGACSEEDAYRACAAQLRAGFPALSVRELAEGFSVEGYSAVVPLCARCGRPAKFRCSKCRAVWYCGRECQVKDWKGGHKAVCGKAGSGEGRGGGADIRPAAEAGAVGAVGPAGAEPAASASAGPVEAAAPAKAAPSAAPSAVSAAVPRAALKVEPGTTSEAPPGSPPSSSPPLGAPAAAPPAPPAPEPPRPQDAPSPAAPAHPAPSSPHEAPGDPADSTARPPAPIPPAPSPATPPPAPPAPGPEPRAYQASPGYFDELD